jgi:hypothetical protein
MAITTREHFKTHIHGATLTDAEIETRINNAIEHAMVSASGSSIIYVDVGPSWPGRAPSPTAKRAMQLAADAGWSVDIDGRTGHLMLDPQ